MPTSRPVAEFWNPTRRSSRLTSQVQDDRIRGVRPEQIIIRRKDRRFVEQLHVGTVREFEFEIDPDPAGIGSSPTHRTACAEPDHLVSIPVAPPNREPS
jgi:hypothetical protein